MDRNTGIKNSETSFDEFLEKRKGLSPDERRIEATRLIGEIDTIDVEKAFLLVNSKIDMKMKKVNVFSILTRIAAILTIPLMAFTLWNLFIVENQFLFSQRAHVEKAWHEIKSPVGMRSHAELPDGTHLWLNAGSILRYSIPFVKETREVELSGEAFLDVAENPQSPFVVKAGIASVEVVGTSFNVNAWPESDRISVALKEGKVKFRFQTEDGKYKYSELLPGDYLQLNKTDKRVSLEKTNIEKYIAWHQNIMILDDTPMTQLAEMLEQWYGVKVIVADEEIRRYRFTTSFVNEPLHRVLELLEMSSPQTSFSYSAGSPMEGTSEFSPSLITITKKQKPMK